MSSNNPKGNSHQRFGPINSKYGHRRLNVLFTRARRMLEIFSSMIPEEIEVTPTSNPGVRVLREYLIYARDGVLPNGAELSGRSPDSDFEMFVAEALTKEGYRTMAQVGVAGYFVDLGVLDPADTSRYILGIECDGASYHSSRYARERDRLRQAILENLGWKIHRVWSTDWFRNPSRETQRLIEAIKTVRR